MRLTKRIAVVCLAASLLMMGAAHATTYYVATTGNDNNAGTSAGSPFKTIQRGINATSAGDTVSVAAGVYNERPVINSSHSGTSGAPISIVGAAGAVIDGSENVSLTFQEQTTGAFQAGMGVYAASLSSYPALQGTNCVTVNDQCVSDLWWGNRPTNGCQPNPVFWITYKCYDWRRMFWDGRADRPGDSAFATYTTWYGVAGQGYSGGWDGLHGLSLYNPTDQKLYVKVQMGDTATPWNISTCNVKVAPVDTTVVTINGANYITLNGFTIKNGYFGMQIYNSVGSVIEHCVFKPVYNGIRLREGADGIQVRYNEYSMNYVHDTSSSSNNANVWHTSKDILGDPGDGGATSPGSEDKFFLECLNSEGNHHIHNNYIHDCAVGIASGWHGSAQDEEPYSANTEVNDNVLVNLYQDAFSVSGNASNHKWHHNVVYNAIQNVRFFSIHFGPLQMYKNIFIAGPHTSQHLVHFGDTTSTPYVYFYNNTVVDAPDSTYVKSAIWFNNNSDGTPYYRYYNNLFVGDRYVDWGSGTGENWDSNHNVFVRLTSSWKNNKPSGGSGSSAVSGILNVDDVQIEQQSDWYVPASGFTDFFTDFADNDLSLVSGSPARNNGANLYTLFGITGSSTDCGALAYGEAMPPMDASIMSPSGPTLSSINPTSGPTAGGTACTLTGANLTGCSSVSFGGTGATGVSVVSSTQVRCTSPARSAGGVNVTATTSGGTTGPVTYTYVSAPTLTTLAPTSGTTAGGTACTLTGTNFISGAAVSFGGTAGTGVAVDSASQIRCTSPAKSAGTYSVTVTTPGGTSGGQNFTYTTVGGTTTTLYAQADAMVYSAASTTKYGTQNNMQVQMNTSAYNTRSYMKFNMTSATGGTAVTNAKLRVYLESRTSATTVKAFSCSGDDSWVDTTSGISWATTISSNWLPVSQQASVPIDLVNQWYEFNVTTWANSKFTGNKLITIILMDDQSLNKNSRWSTKERSGGTYTPQLVVTVQ